MSSAPGPPRSSLPPGPTARARPSLRVPFPPPPAAVGLPSDPPAPGICHLHTKSTLSPGFYWSVATRTASPLDHCLPNTTWAQGIEKTKVSALWRYDPVVNNVQKAMKFHKVLRHRSCGTCSEGPGQAVAGGLDMATSTCGRQDRI